MMATNFKTLNEYFYPDNRSRAFVIPFYQRGYKWSVRQSKEQTSVEYLMESLLEAFHNAPERQYFLQGVTVSESGGNIFLIDGQQRTTTLYLLLWCLGVQYITGTKNINLNYSIREKSQEFITGLKNGEEYQDTPDDDKIQDIFYFKEAIKQIRKAIEGMSETERSAFYDFIMNKVCLLYIVIDNSQAVRIFTMMNGNKATMHDEELTKAEMLHIVSLLSSIKKINNMKDMFAIMTEMVSEEWDSNALRSKYAREWDKWLHWWNGAEVRSFFNVHKPMGLLLEYYYRKECLAKNLNEEPQAYSFKRFRELMPDNDIKAAKDVFKGLRDLQKDFEDIFDNPLSYNYLKCAMIGSTNSADDKYNIIMYFIEHKHDMDLLKRYARWRMLGSTHKEITEEYTYDPTADGDKQRLNKDIRRNRLESTIQQLQEAQVYGKYDDMLYKQLLRLNVKEYNRLNEKKGVKFDFSIWNNKSIEHIYPKSLFYHTETDETTGETKYVSGAGTEVQDVTGMLNSDTCFSDPSRYSEHCIGNLVLLYGRDNSEFGAFRFDEKKKKFFNTEKPFESRNLLHTISFFANGTWEPCDIESAANKTLNVLYNDYKELDHE